ncbi:cytochrome P450 2U1-like [Branchiostoma floridae x Branchiostoma japonicum]
MKDPSAYAKLSKKYGDVFTVYFGPRRVVVLYGYAAIHEALVKNAENFSSRPLGQAFLSPDGKNLGIAEEPYGAKWKEHRKFAIISLRDFGVGKRSMEGKILEETRALGKPAILHLSDDAECSFQRHLFNCVLPGVRKNYQDLMQSQAKLMDHIKERIREHEETFDPKDIRDFIDAYLLESKKRQADENNTFDKQELATIVYQLFLAGTDTTATTLRWALLYMILHPDIQLQEKVQQEIDSVLGPNQVPAMAHRNRVKTEVPMIKRYALHGGEPNGSEPTRYCCATYHSARYEQRYNIQGTARKTLFSCCGGYDIPKGTVVEVILWSVHHDPNLWPEPDKFDPNRFINDAGKYVKREGVIPFSLGRRVCLGEQLARMELFLIFTSLLQCFTFKLPEGAPKPSENGIPGPLHQPVTFMLIAEPRE